MQIKFLMIIYLHAKTKIYCSKTEQKYFQIVRFDIS
jgi:hypothetical protein